MPASRGRFVWFDLLTRDAENAEPFYTAVAGWTTEMWPGSPTPYRMWVNGGQPLGGTMAMPAEAPAPPHWLAYISSPDTDASVARARQLGAKVWTGPMDIPEVGRFAVLSDPWGAEFAIFTPSKDGPDPAAAKVGEFSWHELVTDDVAAALAFYRELFGWDAGDAMDMGPAGVYQMFSLGGQMLGGIYVRPPQLPANSWLHYIRVADLDAAITAVKTHGGMPSGDAIEVPGGDWIVTGTDPTGARFALHQKASDRA